MRCRNIKQKHQQAPKSTPMARCTHKNRWGIPKTTHVLRSAARRLCHHYRAFAPSVCVYTYLIGLGLAQAVLQILPEKRERPLARVRRLRRFDAVGVVWRLRPQPPPPIRPSVTSADRRLVSRYVGRSRSKSRSAEAVHPGKGVGRREVAKNEFTVPFWANNER